MLDPKGRAEIISTLHRLNRDKGITVVLITHYMEEAELLCDRVGFMCHGVLEETDTPKHLIEMLGCYTVDATEPDGVKSHYFSGKEEAIRYLTDSPYETALRSTTLEDVFLEHVGKAMDRG